jgi:molybdopterin/thiamine biosynthesis adenylyltransferase/rhodanese-related sulfurtransferase
LALSAAELARYHRHLVLDEIGSAGQEKLKAARVLVIGAGGLGCPAALYLAASGVGTLGIVDCDRVDVSNLHRQLLFDTSGIARLKVDAARERLESLNPEIAVVAHAVELKAANVRAVLGGYDLVLDGTDRLSTRYLVNDACVILAKPLVTAAIHRFEGQAMTYVPGRGPCYRCLFPEAPDGVVPNCAQAGVLGVLPGVLGTIQATEAIKLILGIGEPLIGRLLTYDALEMRFHEFAFQRRRDCAVCGDRPTIAEPRDAAELYSAPALETVRRLTAAGLRTLLDQGRRAGALVLVDVREPREFDTGHLEGAVNIPITELQRRLAEIPPQSSPVFMCRSGSRSLAACAVAVRAGISAPAHLEGGLLAWASEVDPTLAVASAG